MYRAPLLALLLITALAAPAGAARVDRKNLIKVLSPSVSGGVPAHPFVNVIVSFGRMSNGTAADPASFRARLNGRNITKLFADVGDGTTSDEALPSHVFGDQAGDVTVQLTVSDGQATATDQVQILKKPKICDGCTPGTLHVEAPGPLEFHAVAPGATATLPLVLRNTDATPTSQLHARVGSDNGTFTIAPADVTLGPGEQADLTVTFTPSATG